MSVIITVTRRATDWTVAEGREPFAEPGRIGTRSPDPDLSYRSGISLLVSWSSGLWPGRAFRIGLSRTALSNASTAVARPRYVNRGVRYSVRQARLDLRYSAYG